MADPYLARHRCPKGLPLEERLEELSIPEPNTGCRLWLGATNPRGYGLITIQHRSRLAHRAAYERARGHIPAGLFVCHRCDNPACVNPDHLFVGTHSDNMADMQRKGRGTKGSDLHRARVRRGELHGMAKLTAADVAVIRSRLAAGERPGAIAPSFGVKRNAIYRIKVGLRWGSV